MKIARIGKEVTGTEHSHTVSIPWFLIISESNYGRERKADMEREGKRGKKSEKKERETEKDRTEWRDRKR